MVAIDDRDPGGIVAAIFQPAQTIEQDGSCFRSTDVSDDATHKLGRKRDTDAHSTQGTRCEGGAAINMMNPPWGWV